jgi:SAM-dependent methyltransferase
MDSNADTFWDTRYATEGAIWGEDPSSTARLAARYARPGARVLEVGFGYGRDLAFLGGQQCLVSGVDLSAIGRQMAEARLRHSGVQPEGLWKGSFEDCDFLTSGYDLVVCHRLAHLLLTSDAVRRFACKVEAVLRPEGLFFLGARNPHDLNPTEMIQVADEVYEYARRPGHRIRYWDDRAFRTVFDKTFTILDLVPAFEPEAVAHPVPCHLTVMIARKRPAADPVASG